MKRAQGSAARFWQNTLKPWLDARPQFESDIDRNKEATGKLFWFLGEPAVPDRVAGLMRLAAARDADAERAKAILLEARQQLEPGAASEKVVQEQIRQIADPDQRELSEETFRAAQSEEVSKAVWSMYDKLHALLMPAQVPVFERLVTSVAFEQPPTSEPATTGASKTPRQ